MLKIRHICLACVVFRDNFEWVFFKRLFFYISCCFAWINAFISFHVHDAITICWMLDDDDEFVDDFEIYSYNFFLNIFGFLFNGKSLKNEQRVLREKFMLLFFYFTQCCHSKIPPHFQKVVTIMVAQVTDKVVWIFSSDVSTVFSSHGNTTMLKGQ